MTDRVLYMRLCEDCGHVETSEDPWLVIGYRTCPACGQAEGSGRREMSCAAEPPSPLRSPVVDRRPGEVPSSEG